MTSFDSVKLMIPRSIRGFLYAIYQPLRLHLAPAYNEDGIITDRNCDFLEEPSFKAAEQIARDLGIAHDSRWRCYIACWAADWASRLDGDFVECGVNTGYMSRTIMEYVHFSQLKHRFYLLDTFTGVSAKYATTREIAAGRDLNVYAGTYEQACRTFATFPNVKIIRGTVPDTLSEVDATRVAYLSLDMNATLPEIAAAEFFWPKLIPGGVMLLDDYGYPGYEEVKSAYDSFAKARCVRVLSLPTGQGLIIKPLS